MDKEGEGIVMTKGSASDARSLMTKLQRHGLLACAVPEQQVQAESRLVRKHAN